MGIFLVFIGYIWIVVVYLIGEWFVGKVGCLVSMLCLLFFGIMIVMIILVMFVERFIVMCFFFYYE